MASQPTGTSPPRSKRKRNHQLEGCELTQVRSKSGLPDATTSPGGALLEGKRNIEKVSFLNRDQHLLSTMSTTSSCSSEHSCCDDSNCQLSISTAGQRSEACSLEACLNPEVCDKEECCSDETCIHPFDVAARDVSSLGHASITVDKEPHGLDEVIDYGTVEADGSMLCQWLETDHQCSVTAPPAALSQHVFKDHIEHNSLLPCEWAQCDQTVESQQLLQHVAQAHQPDQYVCLWQGCGCSFSSGEELAAHMSALHCTKMDCHWGGCEFIDMDLMALKCHITDEHLNVPPSQVFQNRSYLKDLSPSRSAMSTQHVSQPSSSSSLDILSLQSKCAQQLSTQPHIFTSESQKHRCFWTVDQSRQSVCSASFSQENDLQAHVEEAHLDCLSARTSSLGTAIFVCNWQDCRAKGSPYNGKDKLRKHTYTHTGCMYP